MNYRKLIVFSEQVNADGDTAAIRPVTRVLACAITGNPLAGSSGNKTDLSPLIDMGAELGKILVQKALSHLPSEPQAYGKAALIGVNGELEHGAALIHPSMGKPIRDAIGGGDALIPSNAKIGGPGSIIDVPLTHRHDAWLFDFLDTVTFFCADGPRPDEIVAIVALSDGGRPRPRVGK